MTLSFCSLQTYAWCPILVEFATEYVVYCYISSLAWIVCVSRPRRIISMFTLLVTITTTLRYSGVTCICSMGYVVMLALVEVLFESCLALLAGSYNCFLFRSISWWYCSFTQICVSRFLGRSFSYAFLVFEVFKLSYYWAWICMPRIRPA